MTTYGKLVVHGGSIPPSISQHKAFIALGVRCDCECSARADRGYPPLSFLGGPVPAGFFVYGFMKYDHIIDYLCATVGVANDAAGLSDERVNKRTEAMMAMDFRRYCCGIDGDVGNDFFKVDEDGQLYAFNGRYYELMMEETLLEMIVTVMDRSNVGIVYRTGSAKIIKDAVMNRLRGTEACLFKPDRRYVCFTNGVLDLESGKLKGFGPEYKTDIVLDFPYEPERRSALWENVLMQTVPDKEMRETFHQFCGCFLADRKKYKIEYILFVVGEGQNGKSIICKAVINMLGRDVASSYSPEQLFKSSQMEYHLADVNGKIVNYCDEVSNKDFSGGDFKQFVSGGAFTGRHPYSRRPTKVDKIPLMLCCANKIPPTTDDTEGYFRRFLIILAPNHVADKDKDPMLEMKLQEPDVKSAIFNWMLEGYRAFLANDGKIDIGASVQDVVTEMRENSNSLRRWVSTMGYVAAPDPGSYSAPGWKSLQEWITLYQEYCRNYGEEAKNRKAVTDLFKKLNVVSRRRGDGIWYYMEQRKEDEEPVVEEEKKVEDDWPF